MGIRIDEVDRRASEQVVKARIQNPSKFTEIIRDLIKNLDAERSGSRNVHVPLRYTPVAPVKNVRKR